MTSEEMRELVRETVSECLTQLGIDKSNPLEMQRDFQFLRGMRTSSSKIRTRIMVTTVGLMVSGALWALWNGIKQTRG